VIVGRIGQHLCRLYPVVLERCCSPALSCFRSASRSLSGYCHQSAVVVEERFRIHQPSSLGLSRDVVDLRPAGLVSDVLAILSGPEVHHWSEHGRFCCWCQIAWCGIGEIHLLQRDWMSHSGCRGARLGVKDFDRTQFLEAEGGSKVCQSPIFQLQGAMVLLQNCLQRVTVQRPLCAQDAADEQC
jgi:hypothetical protein